MIEDFLIACWLAVKQIVRSNKKSVIMTILVVTLLFINILFIASMMSGLVDSVNKQIVDLQYGNIVIEPTKKTGSDEYIRQVGQKMAAIRKIPGIAAAADHYKAGVKITYDAGKDGNDIKEGNWQLTSIVPSDDRQVFKTAEYIVAGRFLEDGDRDKIVLGREVSGGYGSTFEQKSLQGADVGDDVYVYYPNGLSRKYEVVGIFATKNFVTDDKAYVTRDEMEDINGQHDIADEITIRTAETGNEDAYIGRIRNALGDDPDIYSWKKYTGAIASTTDSFDFIKAVFYFIGLSVAGASIFIIIYINLIHQRRQIGILRAIGMKSRIIVVSYTIQALFYGVIGIVLGRFAIEYLIAPYFVDHPFHVPIGDISLSVQQTDLFRTEVSMLAVSFVAGFLPSLQTVRNKILDAILR